MLLNLTCPHANVQMDANLRLADTMLEAARRVAMPKRSHKVMKNEQE